MFSGYLCLRSANVNNHLNYKALAFCLIAAPALAGCNTTSGQDIAATVPSPEAAVNPAAGSQSIYFETGSADLGIEGRETIRNMAVEARQRGTSKFEVAGYADTVGSSESNRTLSQRRAEAVVAELESEGVSRSAVEVTWHGESELAMPTGNNEPARENRRVTVDFSSG
jgi:outer membrane protein OmpA-like peptidoglycan-associated protein